MGGDGHLQLRCKLVTGSPVRIDRDHGEYRSAAAGVAVIVTDGVPSIWALTATIQSSLDSMTDMPPGVTATLGGAAESQQEAFSQLALAMLVAIALIFMMMVGTFRSVVQPLILMASIPFDATGAVAGLLITDTPLGVPAMVGLLMLIGIVVTNAIV